MKRERFFNILFFLFLILLTLSIIGMVAEPALARPGGGHSYSGGGGSGGSGGGGGDIGMLIYLLLSLPPEISIPLVILIVVVKVVQSRKKKNSQEHVASAPTHQNRANSVERTDDQVEALKEHDPNFSKILFLDFVASLYNRYYSYLGKKDLKDIKPFFSEEEMKIASNPNFKNVETSEIVIGNIRIAEIAMYQNFDAVTVEIEANFTMTRNNKSTRYIVVERWLLNRKKGVLSKEPEKMRDLSCPNCGAPLSYTDAGECEYCNTFVKGGDMQWFVKKRAVLSQDAFKANDLAHYEQEVGTNYPTIMQPALRAMTSKFASQHGDWQAFWNKFQNNIARAIFMEIYQAWSKQNWQAARHLVTDRLYDSYNFWQETYKREKIYNRLENINIRKVELARLDLDKFYESITVRIFASCFDYVENQNGKVLGGSKKRPRQFSEYWTFIRRSGKEQKDEAAFDLNTCPNCGAPADKMGQAAECGYCGAKISNGDFSWVLAIITQDEVYRG